MYIFHQINVKWHLPDQTITIKIDSQRIKAGDEDIEPHVKLVVFDQERVMDVLLYYCGLLDILKLVNVPTANIFDLKLRSQILFHYKVSLADLNSMAIVRI